MKLLLLFLYTISETYGLESKTICPEKTLLKRGGFQP